MIIIFSSGLEEKISSITVKEVIENILAEHMQEVHFFYK